MKEIIVNVDNYNENSIKTIEGDNLSEVYKIYICKNKRRIDLTNKIAIMAYVNEYGNKKSNILALNITNASQGEIELPITNVISNENGVYACQIAIYGENNFLEQTAPFSLIVENNIFSKISNTAINSTDFHILKQALNEVKECIKTTNEYSKKLQEGTENIELQYAEKLNKINLKTVNITKGMFESDSTVSSEVSEFTLFSLEYLQQQQIKLLAKFYRNLKKGVLQTICCQGDSLTYGLDKFSSSKRPADDTIYPDGSKHGSESTRANVTYPEALQTQLRSVLGQDKINVITRGYSGDYVQGGYNRWITPSGANLTIFQYGTNDSRGSWVPYKGDVKEFIKWYEKLISREIIRGSAVAIISPPREPNNDIDIFTFSNALARLAYKYNCPFVRGDKLLLNYDNSVYSDELHFNEKGYTIHASRVASALLSRFEKNNIINGSKLGVYVNQDNIYMINGARAFENINYPTPSQNDITKGTAIAINNSTKNGGVCIPFYTAEDDLLLYPNIFINDNSPVDIILDFEVEQSLYSNTDLVGKEKRTKPINKITLNNPKSIYNSRLTNENGYVHIPKKGWHTITIIARTANTTGFYGLEFINYNYKNIIDKFKNMNKERIYLTDFKNGWKNFSSSQDSTSQHLNYYKNDNGEIAIRGYINGGTASQITVLPKELRPTKDIITPVYVKYSDREAVGFIEVTTNGGMYFIGETANLNRVCVNITTK